MKELEELDVSWSMGKTVSVLIAGLNEVSNLLSGGRQTEAKNLLDMVSRKVMEAEEYFWRPVDSDEVYTKLKESYAKIGEPQKATEWEKRINLRKAREIEFKARVQNFCGNNTLALEYYSQAVSLAPDFQLAQDGKRKAEKSVLKARREIDVVENLAKKAPGNPETLVKLGVVKLNLNHVNEAIAIFQRALEIARGDADATTRLGLAYLSAGRYTEAKECFEKVLSVKPTSLNAKRGRNYANYFLGIEELTE
ncbi:MAG: tetratricopeptide repeat protein [Thermoplasmata archaeon]|nr:tetratricopeptide repeat protein [Thermoplasmata archaeon]